MHMLRTYVSWSLLLLLGLASTACSDDGGGRASADEDATAEGDASEDAGDPSDAQPGGDAGADGSADMDAAGNNLDGGSMPSMDAGDGAALDGCIGASCDPCKVALYLLADLSGSMQQRLVNASAQVDAGARDASVDADAGDAGPVAPAPNNRIDAMKNALLAFLDDPDVANTQLGLGRFPRERPSDAGVCAPGTECTAASGLGGGCCPNGSTCLPGLGCFPIGNFAPSCEVAQYAKPDVEFGDQAAVATPMRAAIKVLRATGQSPEIVALEGALSYARSKLAARNKVSVVMFADGPWNACGPEEDGGMNAAIQTGGPVEPITAVAARYNMGPSAVSTYVVAIKGDDPDAGRYFDPVAAAGGTQQAYNGSSGDELYQALKAIHAHATAACK
jgi:hypothetical protein